MSAVETTDRFLRPADVSTARRSRRQVQARRLLVILANIVVIFAVVIAGTWLWQRAHQDQRFAIRRIEVTGRHHASFRTVDEVVAACRGANLFRLDTPSLQAKLVVIPWIEQAAVEKELPDGLRIHLVERVPAALFESGNGISYVDGKGTIFAPFDTTIGGADLPRIVGANRGQAAACIEFLARIRHAAPELFARIAEVRPADAFGWTVLDRALGTRLTLPDAGPVAKWRLLDRIVAAEGLDGRAVEYADLRFRKQIVVRKRTTTDAVTMDGGQQITGEGRHVQD